MTTFGVVASTALLVFCIWRLCTYIYRLGYKTGARSVLLVWKDTINQGGNNNDEQ